MQKTHVSFKKIYSPIILAALILTWSFSTQSGLCEELRKNGALDEKVRSEIYAEISELLSDEQPVDFLVFRLSNIGFQKNVKGVEPGISMGYNYYLWYFD